jgi:hypothetical protein
MTNSYEYVGVRYTQGTSEEELLSFSAPAHDIHAWGGVPTKTERFHGGFQRALTDRFKGIVRYFNEGYTSPTSIVVAFRKDALEVSDLGYPASWPPQTNLADKPTFAHIRFAFEERDPETDDLEGLRNAVCAMLKPRLEASGDLIDSHLEEGEVADDNGTTADDAASLEEDGTLAAENGESSENGEGVEEQLEIDVGQSKLRAFYDFLNTPEKVAEWLDSENARYADIKARKPRSRAEREFVLTTPEQRLKLSLVSLLKPAMIVDGQHRVWGAYQATNGPITFNVCAIKDADWIEQVFQFVVLNKLARPISSSFLTALLNTSLTNEELKAIEPRFETVGIRNTDRVLMKYVNFDNRSPFFEMVSQPGDMAGVDNQGRLSDKGMLRVAKRWYNLQTSTPELRMFLAAIGETHVGKARKLWQTNHEVWTPYFFAFWEELKAKYEKEGVWEKKEKFNLLYIVTLMTLQDMFLDAKARGDAVFNNLDDFRQQVLRFFEKVPGSFFLNWEATGLQSGDGPRHIQTAVEMLRQGKHLSTVREQSELFRKS